QHHGVLGQLRYWRLVSSKRVAVRRGKRAPSFGSFSELQLPRSGKPKWRNWYIRFQREQDDGINRNGCELPISDWREPVSGSQPLSPHWQLLLRGIATVSH